MNDERAGVTCWCAQMCLNNPPILVENHRMQFRDNEGLPPDTITPLITLIINFLRSIGLTVIEQPITVATVLPGISVAHGALVVDHAAIKYPGDLLHEAGHLAIVPAVARAVLHENVGDDGGNEMGAIAWSYAALVHLRLAPSVLFHEHGYRGGADCLIENFTQRRYIGVPMLTWRGLADAPSQSETDATGYPTMKRWLAE